MLILSLLLREQANCFISASVQYTKTLKFAQITLLPNTTSQCWFPSEIRIELILNSYHPSKFYIYNNFSLNTTEITMLNIEIDEDI